MFPLVSDQSPFSRTFFRKAHIHLLLLRTFFISGFCAAPSRLIHAVGPVLRSPLQSAEYGRDAARADWIEDRLREARAVVDDVVHHSDHMIRLACDVLVQHGETEAEREDARILLVVVDARQPALRAQRSDDDRRDAQ